MDSFAINALLDIMVTSLPLSCVVRRVWMHPMPHAMPVCLPQWEDGGCIPCYIPSHVMSYLYACPSGKFNANVGAGDESDVCVEYTDNVRTVTIRT